MKPEVQEYFLNRDFNCAETTLRILNDKYELGLQEQDYKLVGGFGAGCGCGLICGALAGCIAAQGKLFIKERAHVTPHFKEDCAEICRAFEVSLGSTQCRDLRPKYFCPETRCSAVVDAALDSFDAYMAQKAE